MNGKSEGRLRRRREKEEFKENLDLKGNSEGGVSL